MKKAGTLETDSIDNILQAYLTGQLVKPEFRQRKERKTKMKIVITAQGKELSSEIDLRFGRAKWLIVVDTETGEVNTQKNTVDLSASIFGIQTAQNVVELDV